MNPKIGLLGGIGPKTSVDFYGRIIDRVQEQGVNANTDFPRIVIENIPAKELFPGNPDLSLYDDGLRYLQKADADFIAIICNTAHLWLTHFQQVVDVPIIDLKEEVYDYIKRKGIDKIFLLATGTSAQKLFIYDDITVMVPEAQDQHTIDKMIFDFNRGKNAKAFEEFLLSVASNHHNIPIMAACTEISAALKKSDVDVIDTMEVLLDATLRKWNEGKNSQ